MKPTRQLLTPAQVDEYREKGYTFMRGVFSSDEVLALRNECDLLLDRTELIHTDNLRTRPRDVDGRPVVERFDPVIDVSTVFRDVVHDERIAGAAAQCLDDDVELLKAKLVFKLPGMTGYDLHQDYTWWQPFRGVPLLSVVIAIDGASAENGALELVPRAHDRHRTPPGELRNLNDEEASFIDLEAVEMFEAEPGDVAIFSSLTPHRSGPNTSGCSRRMFFPSYGAKSEASERFEDIYRSHFEHYFSYIRANYVDDDEAKNRLFFK